MKWEKKGLIFNALNLSDWQVHTALQPTPLVLNDRIRVFCGFRDCKGISRIGFVDLSLNDPTRILSYSNRPSLDIGKPGCFDDNGVVPCAVIKRGKEIFLYYAGYNIGHNVRFSAFSGLATSNDGGETFVRYQNVPIMERNNDEFLFRAIHSVIYTEDKWMVWYGAGSEFRSLKEKTVPVYNIKYMESNDGLDFKHSGKVVLDTLSNEYRVGRPYVYYFNNSYEMFYGYSNEEVKYRLAHAISLDGKNWEKTDTFNSFAYNKTDFDSNMSAYPSVVVLNNKKNIFYNGNEYGREGFGLATQEY
ncbi:hypothetical protein OAQ34_03845 [Opitutales bacterium]|nr:hypothetical protein [Opitutales bacterium]